MLRNSIISKLSDEELLSAHRDSGRNEYLGKLFDRYTPLLYGICLKYLKEANDAEDALMELFEILLNKITDYDIEVFRTWVYSVAKNHCLQILRKEERIITVDFNKHITEFDQVMQLLEKEQMYDRKSVLKACLGKLPEQQRLSIVYFFVDGLSYADIADKTGYTLKHVKSYIQNGKRNLKNCIEKNNQ